MYACIHITHIYKTGYMCVSMCLYTHRGILLVKAILDSPWNLNKY